MEKTYLEIYDILVHRATSIVGNDEDARDIVQDIYIAISNNEAVKNVTRNKRGYLYGMVTNMSRMFLRDKQRHLEIETNVIPINVADSDVPSFCIDELLSSLTELQQNVVRLHDIDGCSCLEIAFILKRTPIAVKKQLALAHKKLKETNNYGKNR